MIIRKSKDEIERMAASGAVIADTLARCVVAPMPSAALRSSGGSLPDSTGKSPTSNR